MSEDDPDSTRETKQTAPISADDLDIPGFPSFPEREDLIVTQEMDTRSREDLISLEATARYDVPEDLLELATRSTEMKVHARDNQHSWREFVAIVDPRGRILLPSRVQQQLRGKKLRVKYMVEDDE